MITYMNSYITHYTTSNYGSDIGYYDVPPNTSAAEVLEWFKNNLRSYGIITIYSHDNKSQYKFNYDLFNVNPSFNYDLPQNLTGIVKEITFNNAFDIKIDINICLME